MKPTVPLRSESEAGAVRLFLLPGTDYSGLAELLNDLYLQDQRDVYLDIRKSIDLGPVEVRALIQFAEAFQRRGRLLKLENASKRVEMVVRVFRFDQMLADASENGTSTGEFSLK